MLNKNTQVFQNICPHNCYSTCGIRTYVKNGKIIDIEGDGQHPFNQGRLCSKGYTLLKRVYHPERIIYPLLRQKRSYHWQKITWEKAVEIIAEKIAGLNDTREIFFDVRSGNLGVLQNALVNLFFSLGPLTLVGNGLCEPAGADAHYLTFGDIRNPDPLDMLHSRYLIIWGGNPAATCTHQMALLRHLRQNGGKIVVIDPIQTSTASFSDTFIPIKPGTDGALALGMIKYIYDLKLWDEEFVTKHILGWEKFSLYLEREVTLEWSSKVSGVCVEQIKELAHDYCTKKPAAIWQGLGGQRHINGGQNYRLINTLAAITGNISVKGGGIYYIDPHNYKVLNNAFKVNNIIEHRYININDLKNEPEKPIKMAFISSSNPLAQFPHTNKVRSFLEEMDFLVTVEHFFTKTAQNSHLILPIASFFEKPDFLAGYWHKYIGYNQQAIKPIGESKDDFTMARLLALKLAAIGIKEPLNNLPDASSEDFLARHLKPLLPQLVAKDYEEIIEGGYYKPLNINTTWEDKRFSTPSGKVELKAAKKFSGQIPEIPQYLPERKPKKNYPYRLISAHSVETLNSQFSNIDVIIDIVASPKVYINGDLAQKIKVNSGDKVRLYNNYGEVIIEVEISDSVASGVILCYQGNQKDNFSINCLVEPLLTDLGSLSQGFNGIAYHDTFVNISKV